MKVTEQYKRLLQKLGDHETIYPEDMDKDVGCLYDEAKECIEDLTARHERAMEKLQELQKENDTLRKGIDIYERERERYRHTYPEKTGAYFLAGGLGETDDNQLPKYVEVVPAYGCGWSQLYEKTDKTISYEGA